MNIAHTMCAYLMNYIIPTGAKKNLPNSLKQSRGRPQGSERFRNTYRFRNTVPVQGSAWVRCVAIFWFPRWWMPIWRFPSMGETSQFSSISVGFSIVKTNHFMGTPMTMETPIFHPHENVKLRRDISMKCPKFGACKPSGRMGWFGGGATASGESRQVFSRASLSSEMGFLMIFLWLLNDFWCFWMIFYCLDWFLIVFNGF